MNMARDSQGNIWFSTWTGIARYDGKKFDKWTGAQVANLAGIGAIYAAPGGKVWFGARIVDNPTVFSFDGEKFSYFTGNQRSARQSLYNDWRREGNHLDGKQCRSAPLRRNQLHQRDETIGLGVKLHSHSERRSKRKGLVWRQ